MDDRDFERPWVDSPPSAVQVRIPQTERATRLAKLKQQGQKVDSYLLWVSTCDGFYFGGTVGAVSICR